MPGTATYSVFTGESIISEYFFFLLGNSMLLAMNYPNYFIFVLKTFLPILTIGGIFELGVEIFTTGIIDFLQE
jgi:hypothetical protein